MVLFTIGALIVAFAVAALGLSQPRVAFTIVLIGGITIFDSADSVTISKFLYLAFCGLFLIAFYDGEPDRLVRTSAVVALYLGLMFGVRLTSGGDFVAAFRGAANYGFLCTAAIYAHGFARRVPTGWIQGVSLAFAGFAVWGFFSSWTNRRGLGTLPEFGSASVSALAFAVAYAATRALTSSRAWLWWPLSSLFVLTGLATGTRSLLPIAACPILMIVWLLLRRQDGVPAEDSSSRAVIRLDKAALMWLASLPVAVLLGLGLSSLTGFDPSGGSERLSSVATLEVRGSTERDASAEERLRQTDVAVAAIESAPIFGKGPGYEYDWYRINDVIDSQPTLDTPLLLFSKWGLLGGGLVLYLIWCWISFLTTADGRLEFWQICSVGFLFAIFIQSLLMPITDDKGFPLVLIILGTGRWIELRARAGLTPPATGSRTSVGRLVCDTG